VIDPALILAGRGDDVGGSGARWHSAKIAHLCANVNTP
jgi:hypothetical protein